MVPTIDDRSPGIMITKRRYAEVQSQAMPPSLPHAEH